MINYSLVLLKSDDIYCKEGFIIPIICRLPQGGGGGVKELYDFPLSIQTAQPTAIRSGHIWVKSNIASSINTIKIVEAISAGEPNGTLLLVVGDLAYRNYSTSHPKVLTGGGSKQLSVADSNTSNDWLVQSINESNGTITSTTYFKRPMVYSKVGGILDIEDAYMWNGSSWVQLSQKGSYIGYVSNYSTSNGHSITFSVYNFNTSTNELVFNTEYTLKGSSSMSFYNAKFTRDGMYLVFRNYVYKRVGDVFTLYFTAPNDGMTISEDGQVLAVVIASSTRSGFRVYENNGSTFVLKKTVEFTSNNYASLKTKCCVSGDGKSILLAYPFTKNNYPEYMRLSLYIADSNGEFSESRDVGEYGSSDKSFYCTMSANPFNGSTFMYELSDNYSSSTDYVMAVVVNAVDRTHTLKTMGSGSNYTYDLIGWVDNVAVYYSHYYPDSKYSGYRGYDVITGQRYTIDYPSELVRMESLVVNSAGNKAISHSLHPYTGGGYYILSCTKSSDTITFTHIKTIPYTTSYGGYPAAML